MTKSLLRSHLKTSQKVLAILELELLHVMEPALESFVVIFSHSLIVSEEVKQISPRWLTFKREEKKESCKRNADKGNTQSR